MARKPRDLSRYDSLEKAKEYVQHLNLNVVDEKQKVNVYAVAYDSKPVFFIVNKTVSGAKAIACVLLGIKVELAGSERVTDARPLHERMTTASHDEIEKIRAMLAQMDAAKLAANAPPAPPAPPVVPPVASNAAHKAGAKR